MKRSKKHHINAKELIEIIQQLKLLNSIEKDKIIKQIKHLSECKGKGDQYYDNKNNKPL